VGKLFNVTWFAKFEALKYSTIVIIAGLSLELLQLLIPWRSFNPIDMMYNVIGGI
jgi:glycopeptide antibiotics resistance protein